MRPINVTLDSQTWELAKTKGNFSEWVRNQLRSERNKGEIHRSLRLEEMTTLRIRHELERRIEKQNHDDAKNGEEE
tara:strand:- start:493 stop:720 length:228 start_codon:yes stop_codon:yes gene_type:complete